MSREPIILITGANGEVGHGLIRQIAEDAQVPDVVVLDLAGLDPALVPYCREVITGDILDTALLDDLQARYAIDTIYHLAALLSTTSEKMPLKGHAVNVDGTVNLLELALREQSTRQQPVKFIYPSSIAVYGLPDPASKVAAGAVPEDVYLTPNTMYGCNKLYCEQLGRYYAQHYRQLDPTPPLRLDFRGLRFPGLISAFTLPTGGTSDYAPEMLHAAARGEPYACFVRADTSLPFMVMPDAITALLQLAAAPRDALTRSTYNVTAFSATAAEFAAIVQGAFPDAEIGYAPHPGRQAIVDSWPADVDDSAARQDWGWSPEYDLRRAFNDYLVPSIRQRMQQP